MAPPVPVPRPLSSSPPKKSLSPLPSSPFSEPLAPTFGVIGPSLPLPVCAVNGGGPGGSSCSVAAIDAPLPEVCTPFDVAPSSSISSAVQPPLKFFPPPSQSGSCQLELPSCGFSICMLLVLIDNQVAAGVGLLASPLLLVFCIWSGRIDGWMLAVDSTCDYDVLWVSPGHCFGAVPEWTEFLVLAAVPVAS
ncbi:hypothetical protein Nepgr_006806 [Nepenthes gracilis]|uniref:Uncharacterized protein n=1 Tax=Nepenthes gracilis TaxID=150966 RepID=A0AAD3XHY3_NEPGR|nr:hypothetical protein Nepgr_006806 [Nepenthes gracilis]